MVIIHKSRHRTYLHCVRVIGRIFEQAIIWIEEFSGHQEEELSGRSTVIQPLKKSTERTASYIYFSTR